MTFETKIDILKVLSKRIIQLQETFEITLDHGNFSNDEMRDIFEEIQLVGRLMQELYDTYE